MSTASKAQKPNGKEEASTWKLIFLMIGVWVTFTVFGWATEALTSTPYGDAKEKFKFTWFLVLLQSVGNSLVAALVLLVTGAGSLTGGVSAMDWIIAGGAYLGAHKFGLLSLHYIIFPMQVLVKSCKAIPVMFGEVIFESTVKLTLAKCISVGMLCAGVVTFTMGKGSKKGEKFELDDKMMIGLFFVLLALFCDGVYGPYQNRIKVKAKASGVSLSGYHNMFNMNLWQGVLAAGFCAYSGEIPEVMAFATRNPAVLVDLAKFGVAMALGNVFIFQMQSSFGALTVTKTTTVRKLISVLFSVWYYGHSLMPLQWAGVAMVFLSEPIAKMFGGGGGGHHGEEPKANDSKKKS
uniref:UDP-galactose transporter n=1 Tax=Strombidinopsis acuminata TaxID=141414 RepID=A0A7S3WUS4_9SPIT|mmetsp:Transcript_103526/g.267767  ORF Transcript_103526/g.267767 Transcript_103526/m.267767 type:complete len:350 (-) Transcript_103526:90-1139(-)